MYYQPKIFISLRREFIRIENRLTAKLAKNAQSPLSNLIKNHTSLQSLRDTLRTLRSAFDLAFFAVKMYFQILTYKRLDIFKLQDNLGKINHLK